MDAALLVKIVGTLATAQKQVVTSAEVKVQCDALGIEWGRNDPGWKGRLLETADHAACGSGRLKKWKRGTADNGMVGWSLPDAHVIAAATRWAAANNWRAV